MSGNRFDPEGVSGLNGRVRFVGYSSAEFNLRAFGVESIPLIYTSSGQSGLPPHPQFRAFTLSDIRQVNSGYYLYTITPDGTLTISDGFGALTPQVPVEHPLHHPDVAKGRLVIAAGEFKVEQGLITEINNKTGHFRVGDRNQQTIIEHVFTREGFNEIKGKYQPIRWEEAAVPPQHMRVSNIRPEFSEAVARPFTASRVAQAANPTTQSRRLGIVGAVAGISYTVANEHAQNPNGPWLINGIERLGANAVAFSPLAAMDLLANFPVSLIFVGLDLAHPYVEQRYNEAYDELVGPRNPNRLINPARNNTGEQQSHSTRSYMLDGWRLVNASYALALTSIARTVMEPMHHAARRLESAFGLQLPTEPLPETESRMYKQPYLYPVDTGHATQQTSLPDFQVYSPSEANNSRNQSNLPVFQAQVFGTGLNQAAATNNKQSATEKETEPKPVRGKDPSLDHQPMRFEGCNIELTLNSVKAQANFTNDKTKTAVAGTVAFVGNKIAEGSITLSSTSAALLLPVAVPVAYGVHRYQAVLSHRIKKMKHDVKKTQTFVNGLSSGTLPTREILTEQMVKMQKREHRALQHGNHAAAQLHAKSRAQLRQRRAEQPDHSSLPPSPLHEGDVPKTENFKGVGHRHHDKIAVTGILKNINKVVYEEFPMLLSQGVPLGEAKRICLAKINGYQKQLAQYRLHGIYQNCADYFKYEVDFLKSVVKKVRKIEPNTQAAPSVPEGQHQPVDAPVNVAEEKADNQAQRKVEPNVQASSSVPEEQEQPVDVYFNLAEEDANQQAQDEKTAAMYEMMVPMYEALSQEDYPQAYRLAKHLKQHTTETEMIVNCDQVIAACYKNFDDAFVSPIANGVLTAATDASEYSQASIKNSVKCARVVDAVLPYALSNAAALPMAVYHSDVNVWASLFKQNTYAQLAEYRNHSGLISLVERLWPFTMSFMFSAYRSVLDLCQVAKDNTYAKSIYEYMRYLYIGFPIVMQFWRAYKVVSNPKRDIKDINWFIDLVCQSAFSLYEVFRTEVKLPHNANHATFLHQFLGWLVKYLPFKPGALPESSEYFLSKDFIKLVMAAVLYARTQNKAVLARALQNLTVLAGHTFTDYHQQAALENKIKNLLYKISNEIDECNLEQVREHLAELNQYIYELTGTRTSQKDDSDLIQSARRLAEGATFFARSRSATAAAAVPTPASAFERPGV